MEVELQHHEVERAVHRTVQYPEDREDPGAGGEGFQKGELRFAPTSPVPGTSTNPALP
jgi:hypothetical protein